MPDTPAIGSNRRAWYAADIESFLTAPVDGILGQLSRNSDFNVLPTQRDAWMGEIALLKAQLGGPLKGAILFEFNIPRMGNRADVVLLVRGSVVVIEFKVGSPSFDRHAIEQVWDYALDLKNFHAASHNLAIVPFLIATEARSSTSMSPMFDADGVCRPICVAPRDFRSTLDRTLSNTIGMIDAEQWLESPYRPTPTIVEAARALYAQHSVEDIARNDAGAENLRLTSRRLEEIVTESETARRKAICFLTGVPGAGKTLVGLNVATRRTEDAGTPSVYLSGNGPLVAVLREALTRDELRRRLREGEHIRKGVVRESVKAFIQNVHHFRDEAVRDSRPPAEHVAIFDEAQRAWTREQTASFMQRKKNLPGFSQSEPEFLISYMDRHADWAVVICLVGGGQEINTGEAGIDAWLDAVKTQFPDWGMHISARLNDSEYSAGASLLGLRARPRTYFDDCLHLATSMRSFRAENVSSFVKAVLDREQSEASRMYEALDGRYPIRITRNLDVAKQWVRDRARGSERFGMLASSKAMRLKPHAIDVRVDIDPVHWFLDDKDDTRSSFYLEDAATEFQVQGLELDWTCVTWDADLRFNASSWGFHDFRGSRWTNVNSMENRRYLLNAYRVLMTRARQGMVIFVPPGNRSDHTRSPEYYDSTYRYLRSIGIPEAAV